MLGNAFLLPLDRALAAQKHAHFRWMDDLFIFGRSIAACNDVVGTVDEALATMGLQRSIPKTRIYPNRAALMVFEDSLLVSLGHDMAFDKIQAADLLHTAFDCFILEHRSV